MNVVNSRFHALHFFNRRRISACDGSLDALFHVSGCFVVLFLELIVQVLEITDLALVILGLAFGLALILGLLSELALEVIVNGLEFSDLDLLLLEPLR